MARTPYIRHLRQRDQDRVRHSQRLLAWLSAQATRLSTSVANVFARLKAGATATEIEEIDGSYPTNTVLPAITGTTVSGETLTATNGTWTGDPAPTYTHQWLRNGAPISGATDTTYDLRSAGCGCGYKDQRPRDRHQYPRQRDLHQCGDRYHHRNVMEN